LIWCVHLHKHFLMKSFSLMKETTIDWQWNMKHQSLKFIEFGHQSGSFENKIRLWNSKDRVRSATATVAVTLTLSSRFNISMIIDGFWKIMIKFMKLVDLEIV
jgi:hypothetical protein